MAIPARKSFAQVAAAANIPLKSKEKTTNPPNSNSNAPKESHTPAGKPATPTPKILERSPDVGANPPLSIPSTHDEPRDVEQIDHLLEATNLDSHAPQRQLDPAPQKPSSDTKSVTSRTTLTLDEKDSLRPDDSASMQAAVEDDAFSPGGSAVANSKQGSDPDSRAFRDQLYEIDRTGSKNIAAQRGVPVDKATPTEPRSEGILYASNPTPENFAAPLMIAPDGPRPPPATWHIPPDEKLIEALASPKDRLFVLKIEQDMIDFVKDSKEEFLQLPQTNSFYRMLSHKLADYYLLGHFIDDSMTSVRIFRTPNCRLPPPLIGPNPAIDGSTPPPNAPARKIMRRHRGDGKTFDQAFGSDKNFDSLTSSMATSDVGASNTPEDAANGTGDKSSLTREERENRYNEARARIFKDFEASENAEGLNSQAEKGISRTSSTSGVKKNKKNRKAKDDGFEARSAFDQYGQRIVPNEYSQSPHTDPTFDPYSSFRMQEQFLPGVPSFHQAQAGPVPSYNSPENYGQIAYNSWPTQPISHGYPPTGGSGMQQSFNTQGYNSMNGYDASQYAAGNMASQATPKGNAPSLANYHQGYMPQNESTGWGQGGYLNPYASSGFNYGEVSGPQAGYYGPQGMQQATSPGAYASFSGQNGQFFGQASPYNNYNQAHFNPRSQNFVPATRGGPMQAFSQDLGMAYSNSHPGFSGEPSIQHHPSNNLHGSSFSPLPVSHHHSPNVRVNTNGQGPLRHQNPNNRGQAPPQNSITKWSTPANLPAKPPPPAVVSPFVEVARDPDNQRPLPPKPFPTVDQSSSSVKNLAIR